jgi:hypothetical protein
VGPDAVCCLLHCIRIVRLSARDCGPREDMPIGTAHEPQRRLRASSEGSSCVPRRRAGHDWRRRSAAHSAPASCSPASHPALPDARQGLAAAGAGSPISVAAVRAAGAFVVLVLGLTIPGGHHRADPGTSLKRNPKTKLTERKEPTWKSFSSNVSPSSARWAKPLRFATASPATTCCRSARRCAPTTPTRSASKPSAQRLKPATSSASRKPRRLPTSSTANPSSSSAPPAKPVSSTVQSLLATSSTRWLPKASTSAATRSS